MSSGGGGQAAPTKTTSEVHQSNLPKYAKPYYMEMMNRGLAESRRPYQPYPGQRLHDLSPFTEAGYQSVEDVTSEAPTSLFQGMDYADAAGQSGFNLGQAATMVLDPVSNTYVPADEYMPQEFDPNLIDQNLSQIEGGQLDPQMWGGDVAQEYMSPFMDAVAEREREAAILEHQRQEASRSANAVKAGAFGGTREAVANALSDEALARQLGDIEAQAARDAYLNAQEQFERDRTAGMGAQQYNIDAGLRSLLSNQQTGLEAQRLGEMSRQFGAEFGDQSQQFAAQMDMEADRLNEMMRQQGIELGLRGGELGLQSGQTLGDMQTAYDQLMMDRTRALMAAGERMQDYQQSQLDIGYEDFINQRDAERQNLAFLSALLQGVPITNSAQSEVTQMEHANSGSQALGAGLGMAGLMGLFGGNEQ